MQTSKFGFEQKYLRRRVSNHSSGEDMNCHWWKRYSPIYASPFKSKHGERNIWNDKVTLLRNPIAANPFLEYPPSLYFLLIFIPKGVNVGIRVKPVLDKIFIYLFKITWFFLGPTFQVGTQWMMTDHGWVHISLPARRRKTLEGKAQGPSKPLLKIFILSPNTAQSSSSIWFLIQLPFFLLAL